MSDWQMTPHDENTFAHVLQVFYTKLLAGAERDGHRMIEMCVLIMSMKELESSSIDTRLNGVNRIANAIRQIDNCKHFVIWNTGEARLNHPRSKARADQLLNDFQWFDDKKMAYFLHEFNVLEYIFGGDTHPKLLERSRSIVTFLGRNQVLTKQDLTDIWIKCDGKHETMLEMYYNILEELSEQLSPDLVKHLIDVICDSTHHSAHNSHTGAGPEKSPSNGSNSGSRNNNNNNHNKQDKATQLCKN